MKYFHGRMTIFKMKLNHSSAIATNYQIFGENSLYGVYGDIMQVSFDF